MTPRSIRTKLTAWYLTALVVVMLTFGAGGWWLFRQSVIAAADNSLTARIDGVRQFIDAMQRDLKPGELDDELQEYGQLTAGEALLEVTEGSGRVLYRPAIPGWADVRPAEPASTGLVFRDRTSQGRPYRVAAQSFAVHGQSYLVVAAISMGPAYAAWRRFGWVLALLLPGIGLAAAAGGYWISGRALAPVDRITRAVQAISLRSLDHRLDVPGPEDEIRRLAVTFNEMLTRLQSSVADVVRFTAEASHELRTPVSLVRTTAEVTLSRPRSADEYRDALAQILAQAERMSVLVDDLLALARADAGVELPEMMMVDLRGLAEAAARDMRAAADTRGLYLDLDLAAAEVRGTPESLYRLFLIVLDNAIKDTPRGGHVLIRVRSLLDGERAAGGRSTSRTPEVESIHWSARSSSIASTGARPRARSPTAAAWACPSRRRSWNATTATSPSSQVRPDAAAACTCGCRRTSAAHRLSIPESR